MSQPAAAPMPEPAEWWRGAVIYQVYPRSFQDTNGDGIGDLPGITRRLEHIAGLGVDAVWISPFFPSPMKDFGYDVRDYCDVDPMFGTLADFDALVARAHALGLRVMIDLVLSHTSDEHPWFRESRTSHDNPRANWYVWADAKPDGTPPNNWLSIFGGPAWHWCSRRCQYFLHNFLTSQPDLNFHEPAVKDALLEVARFWLERGVDGFRLDTINFYAHDPDLRDNPPLPPDQRNDTIAPSVNPYNHQRHLYDKNQPETLAFLSRLRALLDEYGAAAVGEVGDAQRGLEILGEYTAGKTGVQMCYAFDFLARERPDGPKVAEVLGRLQQIAPDGWACWAFSNHDVARHASRWSLTDGAIRAYAVLLMCLQGSACLYQGEELGLSEAELAFEDLQDPYGIEFWPEYQGRDGCRTPMVWEHDAEQGGFSTGRPWLPMAWPHLHRAVSQQEADPGALLHHYRRAVGLRQAHPALRHGGLIDLAADQGVLRFFREGGVERLWCALNLNDALAPITLPDGDWVPVWGEVPTGAMAPWQTLILKAG